jgi:cobalt-zinc-cadmium efflux system protein
MPHHHTDACHHSAPAEPSTKKRQLLVALVLVGSFGLVEGMVGLSSHSLALVAEAGHLGSDCFALALALAATLVAQSPQRFEWGERSETWAALINGLGLVLLATGIAWAALGRLQAPAVEIASQPMLMTAIAGLLINGINIALLHRGSDQDLNLRAAFLHVVADALGAVGVIIAAIAVAVPHWLWADGAISLVIAGLITLSALPLIGQSWQALRAVAALTENELSR